MRHLKFFWLLLLPFFLLGQAKAQEVRILYPQEGQDVRGEITARFEGIPAGGYAIVKVEDQFNQATAQDFAVFDTISDRVTFARGDGAYKIEVTIMNAGGKRVGSAAVSFNVANGKVDEGGESVRLAHWTNQDRLETSVQRYRVFAESNADVPSASQGGGPGGGPGGIPMGIPGGAGGGGGTAAPLDLQVSVLLRRVVRDVGLLNNSANITTIVQEAFERQRQGAATAGGGGGPAGFPGFNGPAFGAPVASAAPAKAGKGPWNQDANGTPIWNPAPETGKFFSKLIQQNGEEVNATRKSTPVAITDLLPTFPDGPVRPGSTWETTMSFLGDLSTRLPINVRAPITFTTYENLQLPSGQERRCAKLECRFRLPDNLAKRIAANLASKMGGAGAIGGPPGGPGGPGGLPGATGAGNSVKEDQIEVARTDMSRVLWFDVQRRRILRAEDVIRSSFEMPQTAPATGGIGAPSGFPGAPSGFPGAPSGFPGAPGGFPGAPGGATGPVEPQTISYNLNVTTWFDDRVPNPTGQYVPGGFGAHLRDSVNEVALSRILKSNVPAP